MNFDIYQRKRHKSGSVTFFTRKILLLRREEKMITTMIIITMRNTIVKQQQSLLLPWKFQCFQKIIFVSGVFGIFSYLCLRISNCWGMLILIEVLLMLTTMMMLISMNISWWKCWMLMMMLKSNLKNNWLMCALAYEHISRWAQSIWFCWQ